MKLARVIERVTMRPWLITPTGYAAIRQIIDAKLAGASLENASDFDNQGAGYSLDANGVATVMVSGSLGNRLSMLEKVCGGVDYGDLEVATSQAIEDGAKGLLFHFDSPGGMVTGCPELAEVIASIELPKVAFSDSLCCSAAYYLASSCDSIIATPTAEMGSIGVIIPWVDTSQAAAAAGVKFDPIVGEGDSLKSTMYGPSLTDEQRQYLQDGVNEVQAGFRAHVSKFRDLDFDALKAGAYNGQKALDFNLVDQIGSFSDAYDNLLSRLG